MKSGRQSMLDGDAWTGRALVKNGEQIAARYNLPFLHTHAGADLPLPDLVELAKVVPVRPDGQPQQRVGDALWGGIEEVGLTVQSSRTKSNF